jgi:thiol oxidase
MLALAFFVFCYIPPLAPGTSLSLHRGKPLKQDTEEIPWYGKVSMFHFPQIHAIDLEGPRILPSLANHTADFALVEFYAPWCPHCQHFAPDFERLSLAIKHYESHRSGATPTILTATVDCVRYSQTCKDWGVKAFPTLRWGRRADWLNKPVDSLASIDVRPITAESVAHWINGKLHTGLDPSGISRSEVIQPVLSMFRVKDGGAAAKSTKAGVHWDAQLGAALLLRYAFMDTEFHGEAKTAMLNLVDLLARRFPESSDEQVCRSSFVELGEKLRSLPAETTSVDPDALEKSWQSCGTSYDKYAEGFRSCRATWPGKRGFTCGLWTLFHMLAAQSDDQSALRDLEVVRSAIHYFFLCKECAEHFLRFPAPKGLSVGRRDAQLWWWNAHNSVNRRVIGIEQRFQDADPQFPKVPWWPSPEECPTCRKKLPGIQSLMRKENAEPQSEDELITLNEAAVKEHWDLEEVGRFLDRFYRWK